MNLFLNKYYLLANEFKRKSLLLISKIYKAFVFSPLASGKKK